MKIQLLILTEDTDYAKHLSQVLMERYSDTFETNVVSSPEHLESKRRYDIALVSPAFSIQGASHAELPLVLWDESENAPSQPLDFTYLRKYQRISSLTGDVLAQYAQVAGQKNLAAQNCARITAVWSPVGGVGTTTVALAYATAQVASGKSTAYMDLEFFSSVPVYFPQKSKRSISDALGKDSANLALLLQSIRQHDVGSGIFYFDGPTNYDDMNVLTASDVKDLAAAAGQGLDEVVLDLPTVCDSRCRDILDMVDAVLLVVDGTPRSQIKLAQFQGQNDVFARIRDKTTLICNLGSQVQGDFPRRLTLPYLRADSPVSVYKSLSATNFNG